MLSQSLNVSSEMAVESGATDPKIDLTRLDLRLTPFWRWSLHPNQCYLGRCIFVLRRECEHSLAALESAEFQSFGQQMKDYEAVLATLFSPDRFNYMQLGNEWGQLHVHAIPRYRGARSWNGVVFDDRRWGANPSPKADTPLSAELTYDFASWLRAALEARFGATIS